MSFYLLLQQGKVVRITLVIEAHNPSGAVIWNRQFQGKGYSYKPEAKNSLVSKAVQDALDNSTDDLNKFMQF